MAEPVDLAAMKEHLRVTDNSEDATITAYIAAAREHCEQLTDRILVQRQITEARYTRWGVIRLYRRPIVSVDSVAYTDTAGNPATYTGARLVDGVLYPAMDGTWPELRKGELFTVTYTAGYAAGAVPQAFVQAIKLLVGHWFANRETVMPGGASAEVPFAVRSLLQGQQVPVA